MPQGDSARERTAIFTPHLDVLAHTGRSVLVARELSRRGWRVTFAGAGKYARIASEAGFEVRRLPEMPARELVSESLRGKRWPFHDEEQIRPFVEAETALFREVRPDAVVFDHHYTAGISAEIAEIPRISITNIWWTPYDATKMGLPETHPVFLAMPRLAFLRRIPGMQAAGNALARVMFARWARPYNAVRARYGLGPLESILDLFRGDAVILPDTPELAPAKNLPGNYHYVGPLVWEPAGNLPEELLESEEFVYVTMGSSADPAVYDAAVAAGRMLEGTRVVVTTGGVRSPEEFAGLPERVRVYDFLPGSAAAARASVVVCQGGIGTIYQALSAGKPVVAVPFMPEQEVYGARAVERAGAGVMVSPRGLTAERLAEAIREVESDPKYREAAERMSAGVDLESGPGKAADVVEAAAGRELFFR